MDADTVLFVQFRYHTNQHPIIKTLQNEGHNVNFLSLTRAQNEQYAALVPDVVRLSRIFLLFHPVFSIIFDGNTRYKYAVPRPFWYYRYLSETDPDIVIVKKYIAMSFVTIVYTRLLGIELVFYDQAPIYADEDTYLKRKLATVLYLILHQERFVRYSPVLGNPQEDMALPRSYYIPFVAPFENIPDSRTYFRGGSINLLMIGKLYQRRKNHLLLLKAVDDLRDEVDLSLTIIGSLEGGDEEYYERMNAFIREHGMEEIVDVKENISYQDVQMEYAKHDVYVLPSRNEPAAVSHLEAMSKGCAIICSDTNGTRHYVTEGQNGFLFSPDDQADLEQQLRRLFESREKIRAFGAHSRQLAQTEYSPDKFYARLSRVVDDELRG